MIEGALNGAVQQLLALKRLKEIVVGSATHGINGDADVVNGGDHDDGKIGLKSVDALEESDWSTTSFITMSVRTRLKVFSSEEHRERTAAVGGLLDCGIPGAQERQRNHGADGGLVVDDENARVCAHECRLRFAGPLQCPSPSRLPNLKPKPRPPSIVYLRGPQILLILERLPGAPGP